MLLLNRVCLKLSSAHILNDVSYTFNEHKVYTLTGGNGSGKTTLFNVISGFIKPTSGSVSFRENELNKLAPYQINRLGIGRTFQDLRLALQLTAYENVLMALSHKMIERYTETQRERAYEILKSISLEIKCDTLAGELSYGQQKLLTLGCLIANDAELLLIDEPVAGIDSVNMEKIIALVNELKADGKTIIQIEHHPDYISMTSDELINMKNGEIVC